MPKPRVLRKFPAAVFSTLAACALSIPGTAPEQTEPFHEAALWDALDALNTLRNRLAHKLDPKNLSALLQRMLVGGLEEPVSLADPKTVHAIGFALSALIGLVLGRFSAARYILVQRRDFP
jgi:hypothetical protein